MRAQGGQSSTYRFVCASHNPFYELPPNSVEGTEFSATTERGEEAPPATEGSGRGARLVRFLFKIGSSKAK